MADGGRAATGTSAVQYLPLRLEKSPFESDLTP
jgi:hypothetical protein